MDGITTYGSALIFGKHHCFMPFSHSSACSQEWSGQGLVWPSGQQICEQADVLPFVVLHFCDASDLEDLQGFLVLILFSTPIHLHTCQSLAMLVHPPLGFLLVSELVWCHNFHLPSVHCSKYLPTGFLDLLPYSLVSSWLFSSHPCLFWTQGPTSGLVHQVGPYQCQAKLKTISCAELGSVHSVMLLPFMVTRSHRGLMVDCLSVPCVLPASHQLSKFSSGIGRTVDSQPLILMVNFG